MNPLWAVLLVVILLAGWLLLRSRQSGSKAPPQAASGGQSPDSAYHAVSIKFASNACKAARELEGRRFLSNAAPRLPLAECDVLECSCRFVHHKDRRTGKDRRSPFGPSGVGASTGTHKIEQRQGRDRRHDDDDDLF